MVSFSCGGCGDVLTKKKLDGHRSSCWGTTYTCLDCMTDFYGTDYRSHTSCISEAQKYQGALYREKDNKKGANNKRKSLNGPQGLSNAMLPRNAYVEDAPDNGEESQAVAVLDVPPRAPTPPLAHETLPENVNVFDFLVSEATPGAERKEIEGSDGSKMVQERQQYGNGESQYSQYSNGDSTQFASHGFSYGHAPVHATFERYDSWQNMTDSQGSQALMPPSYTTPGPRSERSDKKERKSGKSDKKRKRQNVEDLDLSSSKRPTSRGDDTMLDAPHTAARVLHSGLTGGLTRLVTDPDFYEDRIDAGPTPISPLKRSKHEKHDKEVKDSRRKSSYTSYSTAKSTTSKHSEDKHSRSHARSRSPERSTSKHSSKHHHSRRGSSSSPEDRHRSTHSSRRISKAIDYPMDRPSSVQPTSTNQMVTYRNQAELFMSFVTKGPDSERGVSINKALKRYHRERDTRGEEKEEDDKELWKSLRLRKNERGEIVLFF